MKLHVSELDATGASTETAEHVALPVIAKATPAEETPAAPVKADTPVIAEAAPKAEAAIEAPAPAAETPKKFAADHRPTNGVGWGVSVDLTKNTMGGWGEGTDRRGGGSSRGGW
jgi:hypothetical protein